MTATAHGAKRTILCVEDEQHLRRDILEELVAAGYEAVGAATGREALRVLGSARPDLILCDISMPELDGHGFLKILRAEHRASPCTAGFSHSAGRAGRNHRRQTRRC